MTEPINLETLLASDGGSPFAALGIDPALVSALSALGYEEPTPIQREAIPPLLAGRDVLGQAATGTGKTAAFALPMLQRIGSASASGRAEVRGLVLVPTRELAMQVAEAIHRYGKGLGTGVLPVYGGQSIQQQLRALRRGVDVIVATPGRALDHIRRGSLTLDHVQVVVLDEADEMLDMGFAEDLDEILEALPETRQTALFSATMPPRIGDIAERHLRSPVRVRIAREGVIAGTTPRVRQVAYVVPRQYKVAALGRVLDMESPASAIVFCRTRTEVDELSETLIGRGYRAEALHGGLSQEQRDRVMSRFREGTTELLIATDVAARGLDIEHLSHVFNYDVPSAPDAYVHRIGRTGRAGREGVAVTLAEPREHRLLRNFEQITKQRISIEPLPTVIDLRTRKLELTRAALRETLVGGDLDGFRVVVEQLAEEFDVVDVATAAVKLAHQASTGELDEAEIPTPSVPRERAAEKAGARGKDRGRAREGRDPREKQGGERRPRRGAGRADRGADTDVTRLYVALGRRAGVRPADLVGAIANEAGIDARALGSIEIADRFSIVEVPDESADDIIGALRSTTIRGRRVMVRRDREDW
jgi:ATP-dependent RNA helicase DeaD